MTALTPQTPEYQFEEILDTRTPVRAQCRRTDVQVKDLERTVRNARGRMRRALGLAVLVALASALGAVLGPVTSQASSSAPAPAGARLGEPPAPDGGSGGEPALPAYARAPAEPAREATTVVVRAGDTLWDLAAAHGPAGAHRAVYAAEIAAANELDARALRPGQVLRLP